MKKFAMIVIATVLAASSTMVFAAPVQLDDQLGNISAFVCPNGDNIVYTDTASVDGRTMPVLKTLSTRTNSTRDIDPKAQPFIGYGWNLISDKYFCWVDYRYSENGSPNIFSYSFDSGMTRQVNTLPVNVTNMSVSGNQVAWINMAPDSCKIMVANLDTTQEPTEIAQLDNTYGSSSSLCAFSYGGQDYVLFEDRNLVNSAIRLFNINTKEVTAIAESEYFESNPMYQNGKVFFLKSDMLDTKQYLVPTAGGFIESYAIDTKTQASVDSYDQDTTPYLISNTRNSLSFVYTLTNKGTQKMTVKRYDLTSSTAFEAFKSEMPVSILPESCYMNTIYFVQQESMNKSLLVSLDLLTGNKTTLADTQDLKNFCGYSNGKVYYTAVEFNRSANPRQPMLSNIKLMAAQ